jgi:hypothetical protein
MNARNRNVALLGALAAGLIGIVLGHFLTTIFVSSMPGPTASLQSEPDAVLLAALDELPSGKDAHGGDRSVHMVLTFSASNGHYCRVFQWRANSQVAEGIACRQENRWQVLAWDGASSIDSGFHPAGASRLIDGVMDRLGGGHALDEAREHQAMQEKWK